VRGTIRPLLGWVTRGEKLVDEDAELGKRRVFERLSRGDDARAATVVYDDPASFGVDIENDERAAAKLKLDLPGDVPFTVARQADFDREVGREGQPLLLPVRERYEPPRRYECDVGNSDVALFGFASSQNRASETTTPGRPFPHNASRQASSACNCACRNCGLIFCTSMPSMSSKYGFSESSRIDSASISNESPTR